MMGLGATLPRMAREGHSEEATFEEGSLRRKPAKSVLAQGTACAKAQGGTVLCVFEG